MQSPPEKKNVNVPRAYCRLLTLSRTSSAVLPGGPCTSSAGARTTRFETGIAEQKNHELASHIFSDVVPKADCV